MYYGKINDHDIANGIGVRVSLFVSGCKRHCPGCFNLEAQDFNYGQEFSNHTIQEILDMLNNPWIDGLTILGGEPFETENVDEVAKLILSVRAKFGKDRTIWMYSGYLFEELLTRGQDELALSYILRNIDVLVDGPFIEELRDISLNFRGSSNQRIIDMPNSLKYGCVIKAEVYEKENLK